MISELVCLILLCAAEAKYETEIKQLFKSSINGKGTYYGAGGERRGTCQLDPRPGVGAGMYAPVALTTKQFMGSYVCGMCLKVTANGIGAGAKPLPSGREMMVYIMDQCPGCDTGDLDFALNGDGKWDLQWQAVQCPVGDHKLEYKFQGSHEWYIKFQARNERYPITKMHAKHTNTKGQWIPLTRTVDGFWTQSVSYSSMRPILTPIELKMTAFNEKTVFDSISRIQNDVVIPGKGRQFPYDGNYSSA